MGMFYRHLIKKLFLSVYVDDFKLGGVKENIAPPCGKKLISLRDFRRGTSRLRGFEACELRGFLTYESGARFE